MRASQSNGTAERDVAAEMLRDLGNRGKRATAGADRGYDPKGFVKARHAINVTPCVGQNTAATGQPIDTRTTRHAGYAFSERKRKCIEQCFGRGKVIGPIRQVMVRGLDEIHQPLTLTMVAYKSLAQLCPQCVQ